MGRAFPEAQMFAPLIYGINPYPAALSDEKGNSVVLATCAGFKWLEKLLRITVIEYGCIGCLALLALTGEQVRRVMIPNSISHAWNIGKAIYDAKRLNQSPTDALNKATGGKSIFTGKVSDVSRVTKGFT
jgi:DUF917 family protein